MRPRREAHTYDSRHLGQAQEDWLTDGLHELAGHGSPFSSDEEMAEAWAKHGERIMRRWHIPFRRPRGWWRFTQGGERPETASAEFTRLVELRLLTPGERRLLEEDALRYLPASRRAILEAHGFDLPEPARAPEGPNGRAKR